MEDLWPRCMELLGTRVDDHVMTTWLNPIQCEEVSSGRLILSVPSAFHVAWIRDNYLPLIHQTIGDLDASAYDIELKSRDDVAVAQNDSDDPEPECVIDRKPVSAEISNEFVVTRNLNPRYTFDSFVVGNCNQFANAAALSVSDNLGGNYNPLFLYAGVGLGKTHLMSAIGYAVLARDPSKNVSLSTSEEFTNELINAIRFKRMEEFRNKFRKLDLLLVDDIQFIAGKERTEEEFFHTFNSIYENGKQIVITSDRVPHDLSDLEHRLRSRFSWGLVADLGLPDLETKVAILKRKAFEDCVDIPDDVSYFLAEQVTTNIRELVGYLVRVVAMSSLQCLPLTLELAKNALKDIAPRNIKRITTEEIITQVSKRFNVKISDIKSKKKAKLYSLPRQLGMYLARQLTECSYPEIGAAFGGKDHSTVIHAARKIEKLLESDFSLRSMVEGLKMDLRG
ncbi:MAG: chromosomal replication initiator protein DnaA [Pseudomonadota bacterium]